MALTKGDIIEQIANKGFPKKKQLFALIPILPLNQGIDKHNACNEEDDAPNQAKYITALKAGGDKEERAHHEKYPAPQVEPHLSFSVIIGHGTDH